jgi:hypothetical protein
LHTGQLQRLEGMDAGGLDALDDCRAYAGLRQQHSPFVFLESHRAA